MRARLALVVALVGLAAVGCYHDKYNVNGKPKEEYHLPPSEPRFDEPEKAGYKPPPREKKQDTLMNKGGGAGGGLPGL
jgi:hypothetical protein